MSHPANTQRTLMLLALAALAHGELAMAIEEPAFERLEKSGNIEIRQYQPLIVAEAVVDGDMGAASNQGFRLIADYIFGNNLSVAPSRAKSSEKIAMTAPVTMAPAPRSEKIAMTAPVTREAQGAGAAMQGSQRWRVQFTMPAKYTLASLPKPNNPAVTLRQVPAKRYAVIVFSGLAGEEKVQQQTDQLLGWLKSNKRKPLSAPQLARYNPPWTLPFMRRNEVMVEIAGP